MDRRYYGDGRKQCGPHLRSGKASWLFTPLIYCEFMASDGSPVKDAGEKQKRRERADSESQLEIESLTAAGHAALQTGDNIAALQCFKKALKTATKLRERRLQRTCAFNLGAAYVQAGKPQKGLDFLSCAQSGERGERIADLQFNLATAHELLGEQNQAARHYLQAAQLYRSQGDGPAEGDACLRLARCHLQREEWTEAAESFRRAADSFQTAGRPDAAALALKDAGKYMLLSQHFSTDAIITVLTDSLEISSDITDQDTLGKLLNEVGLGFSQLRLFSEAVVCYEQALSLVRSKPHRLAVVLQNLGAVHNTLGRYQQALKYHRDAAALHGSHGSRGAQGRCFCNLGFALVALGELEEAWESYLHAQQAFRDTDDPSGQYQACEGLGGIKLQMRDPVKASVYFKEALRQMSRCQEVSASVQERLVSKLSEALQLQLILQQSGSASHQTVLQRHSSRPRMAAVISDRQHWRRETQTGAADTHTSHYECEETKPHSEMMMMSSTLSPDTHLNTEHHNTLPEANRNLNNTYEKQEEHHQNFPSGVSDQAESAESAGLKSAQMNSALPLVVTAVTPPRTRPDRAEATPLTRRLKSRFCTVM